jgi:HK97 family phage portal protein
VISRRSRRLTKPSDLARRSASRVSRPLMPSTGSLFGWAGRTASVTPVTPSTALTLAPVFAAIGVIATDLAALDVGVYQKTTGQGFAPVPDFAPAQLLTHSHDGASPAMRFRQALMGHVLGYGNGFAEIRRDENTGAPHSLHLLSPATTTVGYDAENRPVYTIDNGREIPGRNVLHFAGLGFDGLVGYSPIAMCRQAIGLGLALDEFASSFLAHGIGLSGVL